ncbi:MAG: histidine phosphatase family protein [Ginsengibacter sp.]
MKILLIIRHAKSGWNDPSLSDFDRTLTERGKSDAEAMAKRIKKNSITIDAYISSPAKRARKTAGIFMKEYGEKKENILLIPSLYEAHIKDFYDAVENVNDSFDTVAIFSHNPGITDFTNSLECSPIYNMPTCAVFAVKIRTEHWKEFNKAKKDFLFFDYPKASPASDEGF